jgi:hypothetical protein
MEDTFEKAYNQMKENFDKMVEIDKTNRDTIASLMSTIRRYEDMIERLT